MDTVEYAHAQAVERKLDDILKLLRLINGGKASAKKKPQGKRK